MDPEQAYIVLVWTRCQAHPAGGTWLQYSPAWFATINDAADWAEAHCRARGPWATVRRQRFLEHHETPPPPDLRAA